MVKSDLNDFSKDLIIEHHSRRKKTVMKLIGNTWDYDFDDAAFIILSWLISRLHIEPIDFIICNIVTLLLLFLSLLNTILTYSSIHLHITFCELRTFNSNAEKETKLDNFGDFTLAVVLQLYCEYFGFCTI